MRCDVARHTGANNVSSLSETRASVHRGCDLANWLDVGLRIVFATNLSKSTQVGKCYCKKGESIY